MTSPLRSTRAVQDAVDLLALLSAQHPQRRKQSLDAAQALQQESLKQADALRQYEHNWKTVRDELTTQRQRAADAETEVQRLQTQIKPLEVQARQAMRVSELEAEVQRLQAELNATRDEIHTQPEVLALQQQLNTFKQKIHRPRFWTGSFAETFAESLAAMDQAHQRLEVSDPAEVIEAFGAWHRDMEAGLELFATSGFDADVAEGLRRDLICQWVYLRWLELTDDLGRP